MTSVRELGFICLIILYVLSLCILNRELILIRSNWRLAILNLCINLGEALVKNRRVNSIFLDTSGIKRSVILAFVSQTANYSSILLVIHLQIWCNLLRALFIILWRLLLYLAELRILDMPWILLLLISRLLRRHEYPIQSASVVCNRHTTRLSSLRALARGLCHRLPLLLVMQARWEGVISRRTNTVF